MGCSRAAGDAGRRHRRLFPGPRSLRADPLAGALQGAGRMGRRSAPVAGRVRAAAAGAARQQFSEAFGAVRRMRRYQPRRGGGRAGMIVRRRATAASSFRRRLAAFAVLLLGVAQAAPAAQDFSEGRHGMVVSAHPLASAVGADILKAGGNAIDAAVAVGYALAVVDPCCGNIGGGGFMLIRFADGRRTVVNFREKAPRAASRAMYLDKQVAVRREASLTGYLAAGVPGTIMGLDQALQKYGRLDRARIMPPAIALASDGFVLGDADAANIAAHAKRLAGDKEAVRIFLRPDLSPHQAGDRLV